MITPPLVPGEPELASFIATESGARIVYTFNPVVKLRVLAFHGKDAPAVAAAVAPRIPTLGMDQILTLLESDDPRQILLGIFASDMLEAIEAIVPLSKLREHPDAVIAKPATTVYDNLIKSSIETGARWLEEARARRPGQSVIFPLLGDAAHRRQIIRWMIRDNPKANVLLLKCWLCA